jgi:hypothetical protein
MSPSSGPAPSRHVWTVRGAIRSLVTRSATAARSAAILATVSALIATQFLALVIASPALAAAAPAVTGVNPVAGPVAGGTSVVITGSNFTGATAVKFGSSAATSFTVNSAGQITATAPAGSTTTPTVDITVTTGSGTSATGAADEYTSTFSDAGYAITLSASATNPAVGGTITLSATANQDVGPTPYGMSIFDVTTGTELVHVGSGTSTSANVSQSAATVQRYVAYVCNAGGVNIQADSAPVVVTWGTPTPAPVVTSVNPTTGPTAGGTPVTITGTNLTGATAVKFGTAVATITGDTATQITVTSPAGAAGAVDITVTTAGGTSATSSADRFTYAVAAPTITAVSPTTGPTAGGTSVVITGTNMTAATAVEFGATAATAYTVNSATQITATSPAEAAATVDITVTTAGGTSATGTADQFTYLAPGPNVTSLAPATGTTAGGTSVVITGTNLTGATAVKFGTTAATAYTVNSATQITATSPAEAAATVDVSVSSNAGTSEITAGDKFIYVAPPTVTSVSPATGTTAGGTSVVITGTNLTGATAVKFGATAATAYTVNSATQITATSPAEAAATVDITVTTAGGTSAISAGDKFTYQVPAPAVTSVNPTSGPGAGGTSVVIAGSGFTGATAVSFGTTAATAYTVNSATQITATSPAGSGTVDVEVTTSGGGTSAISAGDKFTYVPAPAVTGLSPTSGFTSGGTSVVITGTNLTGATAVKFGTAAATAYTVNSATQITATSPSSAAGTVDVTVTTAGGTSVTGTADQFTFAIAPPAVTSVSPTSGPVAGGSTVVISGSGFSGASAVAFGTTAATAFTVNSATQITATAPAEGAGTVDVIVTTAGGPSSPVAGDHYTFVAAPTVTGVSPATGTTAGGTSVVITGTNLTGATAVKFGTAAATGYTVNSATQITATSPAGTAGTVDITVTTAGGTSLTGSADQFTYAIPAPSVSSLSPAAGPTAGGPSVVITGTNLGGATAVKFGTTAATGYTVNSATQITATSPAGSAGTVDVVVTTGGGTSAITTGDKFTYAAGPTVTAVSPTSGPTTGATSVVITGTNLSGATAVKFGTTAATGYTVNSATQIVATSPAGTAATVDITVTTPGGTSTTGTPDQFTYVSGNSGPPSVAGVSPTSGPVAGGTSVVISGSNLLGATAVKFGTTAATGYTVNSASQITATAPAGSTAASTVDVTVTTPQGTSPTSVYDEYTSTFSNGGYAITLSTSATNPAVGGTITLSATANQDVGPTPYGMSIFDVTTGTELVHVGSGTTVSVSVSQSSTTVQRYVAYVCNAGGANAQADSSPAVVTWGNPIPAPTVSSVSPANGPTAGGTAVVITGTNLTGATAVKFGTTAATGYTVNSATQITATAPAEAAGTIDITVTTGGGTSAASTADHFTFVVPAPTVTGIAPTGGTTAGGTAVVITGTNLTGATAVKFGTTAATGYTVNSATQITATAPAEAAGTIDITVTTAGGTSTLSSADQFTYAVPGPAITAVSPKAGPTAGGTSVVITGTNLTGATAVKFGTTAATGYTVNSATQITATAPAEAAGTVDITVTTGSGTSAVSAGDQFTYVAAPAVTGINPTSGYTTGGTSVVITGTNLTGATAVKFGTTAATGYTVNSATQITATSPSSAAGTVDITVTTAGGTSATGTADQFTYLVAPPAVTAVSPAAGSTAGGTSVVITGTSFTGVSAVAFGGSPASSYTVNSTTQITATAPAGSAGTVDITVAAAGGTSATATPDQFTYVPPPTITNVNPASGYTSGGPPVVISGTNLTGATAVTFGAIAATFTVNSSTQITAAPPAGTAGTVDISVTTPGGTSTLGSSDHYSYVVAAPAVSAVSPASGTTAGGTSVVITGSNLSGASAVDFGTTAATGFTVNSSTQITATAPAGTAGTVDIIVTTAGGPSSATSADHYTFVTPPTVFSVSPNSGPTTGGTSVVISGTNFTGATAVEFGTTAATGFTVNSATQITATSPAGTVGTADVVVTTGGGPSGVVAADRFTWVAVPTITGVSPATGLPSGGTSVVITGTNLTGATAVKFGTTAATSYTVNSATQITATSPAEASGTVDITVTTGGGTTAVSAADHFTYSSVPATISAVGAEVDGTTQPSASTESLSVSPAAKGDLLTLAIETKFPGTPSFAVSGISGGGVTTWTRAYAFLTLDGFHGQELWYGVVTTPGSSTITVSFTSGSTQGTSESATSVDLQEFKSSSGAATVWTVDKFGKVDNGNTVTTVSYPTLTPASTSELYFGYVAVPGSVNSGSTPGCVYQFDARGNQIVYDTSVSSTITPTAPSNGSQTFASEGMLVEAH